MSCPQIWNIEQEKNREKEKVGDRLAKLNDKKGDRDLEREIKNKGDIFLLEDQHKSFEAAVTKKGNASGHQCKEKMSGSEQKKVNENTYNISSVKSLWKFHVVVVQNNGKEMRKKVCCTCKVAFLLVIPIVVFTVLRRCLRRLALHDLILCFNKLIHRFSQG